MVIGGGITAERKVNYLLAHGAKVTIVSPQLCDGLTALAKDGKIKVIKRPYSKGDLDGVFLAIAATDERRTNADIVSEGREKGTMLNVVDSPEECDFILPSVLERGNLTIAVSSSGKSPALARKLREKLENELGTEYADLASLIDEVRSELKQRQNSKSGDEWQHALDFEILLPLLRDGDTAEAKKVLMERLAQIGHTV